MSSSSDQVTPEDGEYAIEVTGFSFAYGSGGAKELTDDSVLREVEFKIPHKSRVLIVGLNGRYVIVFDRSIFFFFFAAFCRSRCVFSITFRLFSCL